MIYHGNIKKLSRFTGPSIPKEARPATTSLNIINGMRAMCLRWVGQIGRGGPSKFTFQALKAQVDNNKVGDLLMDTLHTTVWKS